MSKLEKKLLIVIVNYKTPDLTINCLSSLQEPVQALQNTNVVVVDNASGDNSVSELQSAIESNNWGDWVRLLPSEHNGGFAYGNNFALRPALASDNPPDYFLLLNPDTLVKPNTIAALVDFMESNLQAGIAGSNVEDGNGKLWSSAFRFPSILSELDNGLRLGIVSKLLSHWQVLRSMGESKENREVDWLPGCSLLIRKEVFEAIGLLDDEYFLYYEETDFCFRAKQANWSCWYVPESIVVHLVGQSSGLTLDAQQKRKPQYWFDSRRRYFVKNNGWFYAAITDLVWIIGITLNQLRSLIQNKQNNSPPQFLQDSIYNSVFLTLIRSLFRST